MIRAGYGTVAAQPVMPRPETFPNLSARRTRQKLEIRRRVLRDESRRALQGDYLLLRWREDLRREREVWCEFYEQYDALVGLLCLAAHQGIQAHHEQEYRERRNWFLTNYPPIKRIVLSFLERDATDIQPHLRGLRGRRSNDAFEAMFLPATIDTMLRTDSGNLINRLMRTQVTLERWAVSLERREQITAPGKSAEI